MGARYTDVCAAERSMRSCNDSNMLIPAIEHLKSLPGYSPLATVRRILSDHSNFTLKRDGADERDLVNMLSAYADHIPLNALLALMCEDCQTLHQDIWNFRRSGRADQLVRNGLWNLTWEQALPHLRYLAQERKQYEVAYAILTRNRDAIRWPRRIEAIVKVFPRNVPDYSLVRHMQAWRSMIQIASE